MPSTPPLHLTLDRRLVRHPRAYHLRRMRMGLWLYLDLLARLPAGADTLEVEPSVVAGEMGVPEGFIRSWLGHLNKSGYLSAERLNGKVRVTIKRVDFVESVPPRPSTARFFTVLKLQRALGEHSDEMALQAVLNLHSDGVIKRALAGALAVPGMQIRKSRTALFIYLLQRHAKES